jgi:hypothetical protein
MLAANVNGDHEGKFDEDSHRPSPIPAINMGGFVFRSERLSGQ